MKPLRRPWNHILNAAWFRPTWWEFSLLSILWHMCHMCVMSYPSHDVRPDKQVPNFFCFPPFLSCECFRQEYGTSSFRILTSSLESNNEDNKAIFFRHYCRRSSRCWSIPHNLRELACTCSAGSLDAPRVLHLLLPVVISGGFLFFPPWKVSITPSLFVFPFSFLLLKTVLKTGICILAISDPSLIPCPTWVREDLFSGQSFPWCFRKQPLILYPFLTSVILTTSSRVTHGIPSTRSSSASLQLPARIPLTRKPIQNLSPTNSRHFWVCYVFSPW